jgi:hypothetical protein
MGFGFIPLFMFLGSNHRTFFCYDPMTPSVQAPWSSERKSSELMTSEGNSQDKPLVNVYTTIENGQL